MTPHPSAQGRFLAARKPRAHNLPVSLRLLQSALLGAALFVLVIHSASADQTATDYTIPADVIDAGGADVSKSNLYLLSDSIGEPVVGFGASDDYILNSGYRQPSAAEFLSLACSSSADIGSVAGTGVKTGSGTCVVYTDAYNGYNLGWSVRSGSGGTNTGYLISQYNDTIAPFTPATGNVPETWSVAASDAEWGGRVRSVSTDAAAEWGTDGGSEKWLNIATVNRTIVSRQSATPLSGSTEIIQFRAEVGSSAFKPTGIYRTTVTFTLVGY